MKNTFIKSGKPIDANITSVGKNANNSVDKFETLSLLVIILAKLYASNMFSIENKKGNITVANSFVPNIVIEMEVSPVKPTLKGKTRYPK